MGDNREVVVFVSDCSRAEVTVNGLRWMSSGEAISMWGGRIHNLACFAYN